MGQQYTCELNRKKGSKCRTLTVSCSALETEACQVLDKQREILAHRDFLAASIARCYSSLHKPKVPP